MTFILPISENLSLVHSPLPGAGKTKNMARGLLLRRGKDLFAGESAGFGLPVVKKGRLTIFPSLLASGQISGNVINAVYKMDRTVKWRIMGVHVPSIFSLLPEALVRIYMKQERSQQRLLCARDSLFSLFRIDCTMSACRSRGDYGILYETGHRKLMVSVDGTSLAGAEELILLNEVPGRCFTRFRTPTSVFDKTRIPAWRSWPPETIVEDPTAKIGFSVSYPAGLSASDLSLWGGREVGYGLDWAGLSLTASPARFSYDVLYQEDTPGATCREI